MRKIGMIKTGMKKTGILLLSACILLAGCGQGAEGGSMEQKSGEIQEIDAPGRSDYPMVKIADVPKEDGAEDPSTEIFRGGSQGENPAEISGGSQEENPAAGSEGGQGGSTAEGSGEDRTKTASGKDIQDTPLELEDAFEQAAYFVDRVYENHGGNTLVSPLSLNFALGLAAEGASGKTAEELYSYLGNSDYGNFAREYMEYADSLTREADTEYELFEGNYSFQYNIANSIWTDQSRKLTEEYRQAAQDLFHAEVDSLDFRGKPAQSVKRINSWCEEKTKGLIPEILSEDCISEDLAAILVNTVYFESPWTDRWILEDHTFTGVDGETTEQEMLSDTLSVYYENEHATAFGKSYFNGFEFIGILPKEEGDFQVSDLDLKGLLDAKETTYDVRAIMPKLDYESATSPLEIVGLLKEQGVRLPFERDGAEFDRMMETEPGQTLYISDILQKCKIELDEEGTRAAAVTAMMMNLCAAVEQPKEVKEVYLDRPFAFLIYDNTKGEIVFAGKVTTIK